MSQKKPLLFVVQQHHATHMHWDFRLEMDDVLVSWAIPKGPSTDPQTKRLSFRVEDHVYGYKDFEGIIPGNDYGSGKVIIWDRGEYLPLGRYSQQNLHQTWLDSGKLEFELKGQKLKGGWNLIRTSKRLYGEDTWLLIKKKDQYASTGEIVHDLPNSVVSGKTIAEITARDGVFRLGDYK
ncbi:MAG: DNA ligase [Firmicutes bacterium]|nr:DNA ligase [Bacillota bacterium]